MSNKTDSVQINKKEAVQVTEIEKAEKEFLNEGGGEDEENAV